MQSTPPKGTGASSALSPELIELVEAVAQRAVDAYRAKVQVLTDGPPLPRMIGRREAARVLGVSLPTFDRLRHEDGFPTPIRLGTAPKWLPEKLLEWAGARPVGPVYHAATGTEDATPHVSTERFERRAGLRRVKGGAR